MEQAKIDKIRLTHERLCEALRYDEDTGIFYNRFTRSSTCLTGQEAGTVHTGGSKDYPRIIVCLDKEYIKAHHLAWFWNYKEWPTLDIDHIDGNSLNNRVDNLREVTNKQNSQNKRRAQRDKKYDLPLGVRMTEGGRFTAGIGSDGKHFHLGTFDTPEEAHEAYVCKKRELHEGNTL